MVLGEKLNRFEQLHGQPLVERVQTSHDTLSLANNLLTISPNERYSAEQALDAEYFWYNPAPIKLAAIDIALKI